MTTRIDRKSVTPMGPQRERRVQAEGKVSDSAKLRIMRKECDIMSTAELLDELQKRALQDESVRRQLLATREEQNPQEAFCREARALGYPIYLMELINVGEEFYAAMRRSTNGGGENSPMLVGEDDFYELFFASLGE